MGSSSDIQQRGTSYDFLFKLLVIGEPSVGKSSLLLRFAENIFSHSYTSTIGVDFKVRTIMVDNCLVKLQIMERHRVLVTLNHRSYHTSLVLEYEGHFEKKSLSAWCGAPRWDTAGQERFRTLVSSYYRGAHGILIVFDITNEKTFGCLPYWLRTIEKLASENVIKLLVGNKCDLVSGREVSHDEVKRFAEEYCLHFIESSAKTTKNVEEAFLKMAREIKDLVAPTPYLASISNSIRLQETLPVDESSSSSWWYC